MDDFLIDTHCHLDDPLFTADFDEVMQRSEQAGVKAIVIPAVEAASFERTMACARRIEGGYFALGIHPMYVPMAKPEDLHTLERYLELTLDDPRLVAVGEIGLDFFMPALRTPELEEKQIFFYNEQLKLAQKFELPVLLHVRRSQDLILKYARRYDAVRGIAHAFNGSFQQAERFLSFGYKLGMGGAMTFSRAKQIRRLATQLPLDAFVLETDAPDIPPAWLHGSCENPARNEPCHLARIADTMAALREIPVAELISTTGRAAMEVLPRLALGA